MCVQCAMGASATVAAAAGVSGVRAWLGTRTYAWMTAWRLRLMTACMIAAGLIGSSGGPTGT